MLGLLIGSIKGGFDQVSRDVNAFATELILVDRALRLYGPVAEEARALLTRYTQRALEETWPGTGGAAVVEGPSWRAWSGDACARDSADGDRLGIDVGAKKESRLSCWINVPLPRTSERRRGRGCASYGCSSNPANCLTFGWLAFCKASAQQAWALVP